MVDLTSRTNGRTGTQKLRSGIGAALAVLVLTSMLAAPVSALSGGANDAGTNMDVGEDVVQERHFEDVDGEDVAPASAANYCAENACHSESIDAGSTTLESGEFVIEVLYVDAPDVLESGQFGFDVLRSDSGDDDTADS